MPLRQTTFRVPRSSLLTLAILTISHSLLAAALCAQDDPFAAGVRSTPWLSPADEQRHFKLPPGFEINLVAAEPDIQKPLNMAFDERGRIWLTCSVEYPYAAPPDRPANDTIKILEDTDGDGRYEKITTFADSLNIPMGIYPWKGGCVAFSIPNIWHFEDTDADGVCDKRTVLYGPFDTSRDTHGMVNSFRRGWDGWIYACHGFNNDSRVKGRDGHEIHMQSGNVFRFQLDGSRIEHFTHGQVNPFGMCFDGLFNIFTADCHSKPIYQLLRGGYYPSFGKPHDGLGFVPPMMDHTHGSTAICGLAICDSENFPREYLDEPNVFSGNVMTSRINRNKIEFRGSTARAIEQPDFLVSGDPWFRPVDIHFGPDRAMYILDFYNRIIGHYEVPLPHPGRDRTSGRIWRVIYTKPNDKEIFPVEKAADLTKLTNAELIQSFGERNDRLPALGLLRDTRPESVPLVKKAWKDFTNSQNQNIQLLWLLEAFGELTDAIIAEAMEHDSRWEGTHLMRILSERKDWSDFQRAAVLSGLSDQDPFVARAAADAMGRHTKPGQVWPLLSRLEATPQYDSHLRFSIRMALRDHIAVLENSAAIDALKLSETEQRQLVDLCVSVPTPMAASLLVRHLEANQSTAETAGYLQHAARYVAGSDIDRLIGVCRNKSAADVALQAQIVLSLATGFAQRNEGRNQIFASWAENTASDLLRSDGREQISWTAAPIDNLPPSENPWVIGPRPSRDGDKTSLFYYSLPKGEQRTGIYRSGVFDLPEKLTFWCAGHSGLPREPLNDCNYIRLRDSTTHAILAESRPPRNDTARQLTWTLPDHAGKQGYVELVDADIGNAYAWLAVGRFSLDALNPRQEATRQQLAAEIIGKLKLDSFRLQLTTLLAGPETETTARTAIAQALVALDPDARAAALAAALADPSLPAEIRPRIGYAITSKSDSEYLENLRTVMQRVPTRLQTTLADTLTGDAPGATLLLSLIESGHATPRLLLAPALKNKLAALNDASLTARAAAITAKLPPADAILDTLIIERRRAFARATTNRDRGQAIYEKHCSACHKIGDKGALVGPQLDGIGNRGLDRLLEDILDPNRNVDIAFRTTTLRLSDGRVLSGLIRREEGNQIILADNQGKESSIAKADIDEQQKTSLSLMPANVGEITTPDEFADLMAYLLNQRVAPSKE